MGSKGWRLRKVGAAFPYFLFLVSYSLFPCVFAPLRALRETKKSSRGSKGWGFRKPIKPFQYLSKI